MTRTWRYNHIEPEQLPPDLRREAELYIDAQYDGTNWPTLVAIDIEGEAERAYGVWLPNIQRMGIAQGADATWSDVPDAESGIELWVNEPEEWEAGQ